MRRERISPLAQAKSYSADVPFGVAGSQRTVRAGGGLREGSENPITRTQPRDCRWWGVLPISAAHGCDNSLFGLWSACVGEFPRHFKGKFPKERIGGLHVVRSLFDVVPSQSGHSVT